MTTNETIATEPQNEGFILDLRGVSVHYGVVIGLDQVSVGLRQSEIVAIMGPNGAGKSTVLKAIMGLAPVVAGKVFWNNQELDAKTHEMVAQGISFVPQGRRVFEHLSIEENLEMGCLYLGDNAEKNRRLDGIMELFPILHEKRKHMASQMSGGQQQMLAIGRGLMSSPKALLLDEPTLGLAPKVVKEVFAKVLEINQKLGMSIFVVEHNIKSALDVVTRAYVLDKGKLAHDGTPESVIDSDILTKVFLGQVEE